MRKEMKKDDCKFAPVLLYWNCPTKQQGVATLERTLVILEVSRKQDYIFASKKLRENAQRSAQISYVTSSAFFQQAAGALYREEDNLVYAGGGHTVLQFDSPGQARAFARQVTGVAMEEFRGLELFVKQMPYDSAQPPGDNLKELSRQLEKKKALRRASFRCTALGVEELDPETFQPRGTGHKIPPTSPDVLEPPEGYQFPKEFSELAGTDSFLAVVHIDGNAMGKRVGKIYELAGDNWTACCEKLRRFSAGIQGDFEAAFQQTVEELIRQGRCGGSVLPVRPVILAGDDVCFVTAGDLGLECARLFLERLAVRTNQEDAAPYAACAGVALVHQKYPFHQAYQLSEELCSNAKKFGAKLDKDGGVSALDWHIEFGQLKENLAHIRADYRTEDGGILSLRPVAVVRPEKSGDPDLRTYDFFRSLCRAMKGEYGKTARGKIKDLRTAFKQGELESRFFLQDKGVQNLLFRGFEAAYQGGARWEQYRQILTQGGGLDKEPFRTISLGESSERHCLFFDAIEMIDHCDFLEEVEG